MNILNNFYKNKKVLITGHTGFKGSWLTLWLHLLGAKVVGMSLYELKKPNHFNLIKIKKKIISIKADVSNFDAFKKVIKKYKPEIIFHLAAQPLVIDSYSKPYNTFKYNSFGTLNLLEILKENLFVKSAVFITSDKTYKNIQKKILYKEEDELKGTDPYSASKSAADIIINSYSKSFPKTPCQIGIARAGNVIGGGDWGKNRIIPDIINCWSNNKTAIIRNPDSTRPWQHVLEPIYGYLILGKLLYKKKIYSGEAFNFGPNYRTDITVKKLVLRLSKLWPKAVVKVIKKKPKYKEDKFLKLNSKKAKKKLNWSTLLTFEKLCALTFEWYFNWSKNKYKKNYFQISSKQILEYSKIILKNK
jgi:CDP-glucose 4,6-dehydratase